MYQYGGCPPSEDHEDAAELCICTVGFERLAAKVAEAQKALASLISRPVRRPAAKTKLVAIKAVIAKYAEEHAWYTAREAIYTRRLADRAAAREREAATREAEVLAIQEANARAMREAFAPKNSVVEDVPNAAVEDTTQQPQAKSPEVNQPSWVAEQPKPEDSSKKGLPKAVYVARLTKSTAWVKRRDTFLQKSPLPRTPEGAAAG